MIIVAPTGFYDLDNSTNVTYHISNNLPLRSSLIYPKIPQGIGLKKRNTPISTDSNLGDLVFSVSKSSKSISGNSSKQYEVGQILSFGDPVNKSVIPMKVNYKTEIRHNLNRFDYNNMGLNDSDVDLVDDISYDIKVVLEDRLNQVKKFRANSEVIINVQQKLINDINRNLDALGVIISINSSVEILDLIDKLKLKRDLANSIRDSAVEDADKYAVEAEALVDKLRTVATVVK